MITINTIIMTTINTITNASTTTGHVCFWGDISVPSSSQQESLYDITVVVANEYDTYAALRLDGIVITIGRKTKGGDKIIDTSYTLGLNINYLDATTIVATAGAFAVLKRDRTVVAWGDTALGGIVSVSLTGTQHQYKLAVFII